MKTTIEIECTFCHILNKEEVDVESLIKNHARFECWNCKKINNIEISYVAVKGE